MLENARIEGLTEIELDEASQEQVDASLAALSDIERRYESGIIGPTEYGNLKRDVLYRLLIS